MTFGSFRQHWQYVVTSKRSHHILCISEWRQWCSWQSHSPLALAQTESPWQNYLDELQQNELVWSNVIKTNYGKQSQTGVSCSPCSWTVRAARNDSKIWKNGNGSGQDRSWVSAGSDVCREEVTRGISSRLMFICKIISLPLCNSD